MPDRRGQPCELHRRVTRACPWCSRPDTTTEQP